MPIAFFVCSLPRSGSTWAANWLTTETSLCLHDPEASGMTLAELDAKASSITSKRLGVATTSAWAQVEWLNAHPAPKLVFHRPRSEVNSSLEKAGLPPIDQRVVDLNNKIEGHGRYWFRLFEPGAAKAICDELGLPFDAERHRVLSTFRVTPVGFR